VAPVSSTYPILFSPTWALAGADKRRRKWQFQISRDLNMNQYLPSYPIPTSNFIYIQTIYLVLSSIQWQGPHYLQMYSCEIVIVRCILVRLWDQNVLYSCGFYEMHAWHA
jgi:hypothetical protein